jgi:hypothetical protein
MVQSSSNDCHDDDAFYSPLEQSPPSIVPSKSTGTTAIDAKSSRREACRGGISVTRRQAVALIVVVQLLLLLLLVTVVAICWFRPKASWSHDPQPGSDDRADGKDDDDDAWDRISNALWDNVAHDFAVALQALSSLATAYTAQDAVWQSTLNATLSSSSWPYVTLPSFEQRAEIAVRQCRHCTMVQVVPQVMLSQRRAWEVYAVAHYETSPVHRRLLDLTMSKANGTLASNSSLFRRPSYQSTTNNTYGQRNNQTNATRVSTAVPIPPPPAPPPLRFIFENGLANRIFTWSKNNSNRLDVPDCDLELSLPVPEPEVANTDYYGK